MLPAVQFICVCANFCHRTVNVCAQLRILCVFLTKAMKHWSQEAIVPLIDSIEHFEFLYNTKHELYHNRRKRRDALDIIMQNVLPFRPNTTVEDIKAKWNCLRTQFSNEVQKLKDKPSVSGFEDSAWWCFEKLQFLRDHITVRKSTSSMPDVLLPVSTFEEIGENLEELEASQLMEAEPDVAVIAATPKGKKRKVASEDSGIPTFLQAASDLLQNFNVTRDEHDEFGAFVASRLRALSTKRLKKELRKKIMLAIVEVQDEESD